jgi:CDP-2,3-bis-(O-geranylgeranyl)-sn-glycerol synthase
MAPVSLAGLGHVAVLKAQVLSRLAVPIDNGAYWRGRRIFGENKTWRGLLLMSALSAAMTQGQDVVARRREWPRDWSAADGARLIPWKAGALMGLSYSLAELPNSFVKRQLGIAPGERARPFSPVQYAIDQIDSVAGCSLALWLLYRPRRKELALAFFMGSAIHIAVDQMTYAIGVKRRS